MRRVEVFTDGSCSPNPGPGGWGAIVRHGSHVREISGAVARATNNRMEMTAAIEALRILTEPCEVVLTTDSRYLVDGVARLSAWARRGWRTSGGEPVKNRDLWEELEGLLSRHSVRLEWVRGHDGHSENERCDELARLAAARL